MTYTTHNTTDINPQNITIRVPITEATRQKAQAFAQRQVNPEKSEQVYRNVLAVLVTRNYLAMLGIESDLERSDSWDLASHLAMDVADLYIPEINGRIECRSMRLGEEECVIPTPTVEDDRDNLVGYIVLQLNERCTEGTMLGFVPYVTTTSISLQNLQSLNDFAEYLAYLLIPIPAAAPDPAPMAVADPVASVANQLTDWLQGVFRDIWQPPDSLPAGGIVFGGPALVRSNRTSQIQPYIDQLYASQSQSISPLPAGATPEAILVHLIQHVQEEETRFQAAELLWEIDPTNPAGGVRRSLDLSLFIEGHFLGLLGAVLEKSDGRRSLLFQIYPTGDARFIPQGLQLIGLDENGEQFFEVTARAQADRISMKLVADEGDRFSIRVVLNDASLTESFVV